MHLRCQSGGGVNITVSSLGETRENQSFAGLGKLIKFAVANAITTEQNFGVVISLTASIRLIEPEFLPADRISGSLEFRQSL